MRLDLTGDANIIRVCMRVDDIQEPGVGSEIVLCAECDAPIWRAKDQVLRNPENGEVVVETHCLCPPCNAKHMSLNPEAQLVMPSREELMNILKELFSREEDNG
jgi:hypothetical protein